MPTRPRHAGARRPARAGALADARRGQGDDHDRASHLITRSQAAVQASTIS